MGPTIAVMPPPGKPFEAFVQDDQVCRQWASATVGQHSNEATNRAIGSALVGMALGAATGAMADGSDGAGTGAAIGTVVGSGIGYSESSMTGWSAQRGYDISYQQCMYSKGNVIPGYYPTPAQQPLPEQHGSASS
jgi:hypothetical protein